MWGPTDTYKVIYHLPPSKQNGRKGVALVEGRDQADAMQAFREQYEGEYFTIESCKKLID